MNFKLIKIKFCEYDKFSKNLEKMIDLIYQYKYNINIINEKQIKAFDGDKNVR